MIVVIEHSRRLSPQFGSVSNGPNILKMQGPRQPSHRAVHLLEGIQLAAPAKRVESEDETPEEKPESDDVSQKAGNGRPRGRLRDTIAWCRRHMRFLGPGLIASAAFVTAGPVQGRS